MHYRRTHKVNYDSSRGSPLNLYSSKVPPDIHNLNALSPLVEYDFSWHSNNHYPSFCMHCIIKSLPEIHFSREDTQRLPACLQQK